MLRLCNREAYELTFMQKERRQTTILELIADNQIGRQDNLAELLEKRGFSVTQSSVSRDLEELGIIKSGGFYALPQKSVNAVTGGLLSLKAAGENLIVAKTESGLASAVAVKIDAASVAEIVGTIAGDDTIFIAVENRDDRKTAIKKVWEIFEK